MDFYSKLFYLIEKEKNLNYQDNKVFLFSKEGYLLTFDYKNGEIESVNRILKSGLGNDPIFANGYLYSLDNNNRLFQFR